MNTAISLPLLAVGNIREEADDVEPGARYYVWSATQIDTFLDCKCKWAWDKIARLPRRQQGGAQVGDACHKQQEKYLRGEPYDFTQVVNGVKVADVCASAIHNLPDPRDVDPKLIETEFRWQAPGTGFVYTGRKDLELRDSGVLPGFAEEHGYDVDENGRTGVPAIVDHKFMASLGYAKEPEDLEWDTQANLYAYDLMQKWGATSADLVWNYAQTKGGKGSRRVHLRVTRDQAVEKFRLIETVAKDMARIKDAAPKFDSSPREGIEGPPDMGEEWRAKLSEFVHTLEANPGACSKYGRCPHEHACRLTPEEEMVSFMSGDSDLFDSLKKRAQKQDEDAGVKPTPAAAPAELPKWATDPVDPLSLKKQRTTTAPAPEPETASEPAINPPESTLPAPTLPPPPAHEPGEKKTEEQIAAEGPKTTRGRPKGSKNKHKADAEPTQEPEALPAPSRVHPVPISDSAVEKCSGDEPTLAFELYIDCSPVGDSMVEPLEKYTALANQLVQEHSKTTDEPVADYRFLGFGKGPGALAIATVHALKNDPPAKLVARSSVQETGHVLSAILPYASKVTQGFR